MNLRNLYLLSKENPQAIERLAEEQGLDPVVSIGVMKLMLANEGNYAGLSENQKRHFDLSIKPLIED